MTYRIAIGWGLFENLLLFRSYRAWYPPAPVLWQLSTPRNNLLGPTAMSGALASLRSVMTKRDTLSLALGSHDKTVGLYCQATGPLRHQIDKELRASYPDLSLHKVAEASWLPPAKSKLHESQLHLAADLFPIASLLEFDDQLTKDRNDPIAGLLNAVADKSADHWARIVLTVQPASRWRTYDSRRLADRFYGTAMHQEPYFGKQIIRLRTSHVRWFRLLGRVIALLRYPRKTSMRPLPLANLSTTKGIVISGSCS